MLVSFLKRHLLPEGNAKSVACFLVEVQVGKRKGAVAAQPFKVFGANPSLLGYILVTSFLIVTY
ncbi:hypothetical protein [Nostoc edaphicum]|uniref:hypothetical protein n=1 Tax=Nostoc edaphicum TaxID=264686 RepID=UPI0018805B1A|nr:hypothetical protein [Nostoc edaphicum]